MVYAEFYDDLVGGVMPVAINNLGTGLSLVGEIYIMLTYISSVNTWSQQDLTLGQPVKELDSCLFLCIMEWHLDHIPAETINNLSIYRAKKGAKLRPLPSYDNQQ